MNSHDNIDVSNMFKSIYDFPDHIIEAISIGKKIKIEKNYSNFSNIVICGMGGSAIGGDLSKSLINSSLSLPLVINRNYSLPNWVNAHTLVICCSYSGNTEETLSAYHDALSKGASVIGISTGGELTKLLDENNHDKVAIPSGLQPRAAVAFSFIPLLYLLSQLELIDKTILDEIDSSVDKIKLARNIYSNQIDDNPTYTLAKQIYKTIPIIYGESDTTSSIALRWKGQLCENSKMIAYHNDIPEMNHNEIVGWQENPKILKQFSILWISDESVHIRNKIRYQSSLEIVNQLPALQKIITLEGNSFPERFIHLLHYGDWLSYWCALMHEIDPTPVDKIDQLKQVLSKTS